MAVNRGIDPSQAKRFYDRFGSRQDSQGWYEDPAVERMIEWAGFGETIRVFELGFGTGRLAERLLRDHLPQECRYTGCEVSETMFDLALKRLEPWESRVDLHLTDGAPAGGRTVATDVDSPTGFAAPDGSFERFIATYVLDLMEVDAIGGVFAEAWRVLKAGGLLCVVSLTNGRGPASKVVSWLWERMQAIAPERVGGCRPISPSALIDETPEPWAIVHNSVVCRFGVCSEVMIARKSEA